MTDLAKRSKEILEKLSRRKLLRDSAITAAGTVLLPSFITGCSKDAPTGVGGVGGVLGGSQLTPEQLQKAADNLRRMRTWVIELYPLCIEYEDAVFHTLRSTKQNPDWSSFLYNAFIDIATALFAAATSAAGAAPAVPAFAFLSSIIHDWNKGNNVPDNLDAVFAQFEFGHVQMQFALEQELSHLVDPGPKNDYSNLVAAWTTPVEFPVGSGKTYTIGDLASNYFPDLGDDYNALQTAALVAFEQSIWNLVIMKCCESADVSEWYIYIYKTPNSNWPWASVVEYGQKEMYPKNKAHYLRGGITDYGDEYNTVRLKSWTLHFNGADLTPEAVDRLFKDDTPGHIINPDGLFNRDYVFTQFYLTEPFWITDWVILSEDPNGNFNYDYNEPAFTGGIYPELIQ